MRLLEPVAPTRLAAFRRLLRGTILRRLTRFRLPISAISPVITISAIVAIAETAMVSIPVPPERPIVAIVAVVRPAGLPRLLWRTRLIQVRRRLETIIQPVVTFLVPEILATVALLAGAAHPLAVAIDGLTTRLLHLITVGHDDAAVMLSVLEIILSKHRVAGGLGVARQRQILLCDVCGRTPNFHIRSVRLEAA